MYNEIKEKY